jgi:hypothetical protein
VGQVFRGEVQGDEGREGPVEQARGQAVVLGQGEPVPDRVVRDGVAESVLAEVAQQVTFEVGVIVAQAHEAGEQLFRGRLQAAEGEVGTEAAEGRLPGVGVEDREQLVPGGDANFVHGCLAGATECPEVFLQMQGRGGAGRTCRRRRAR